MFNNKDIDKKKQLITSKWTLEKSSSTSQIRNCNHKVWVGQRTPGSVCGVILKSSSFPQVGMSSSTPLPACTHTQGVMTHRDQKPQKQTDIKLSVGEESQLVWTTVVFRMRRWDTVILVYWLQLFLLTSFISSECVVHLLCCHVGSTSVEGVAALSHTGL